MARRRLPSKFLRMAASAKLNLISHALPQGPGVHPGRQPQGLSPAEASAGARRPL